MHSQTVLPLHCHNLLHGGLICCRVTHVMEKTFFNMSDYHNIEIVWRDVMLSCCGTCGTRPTNEFHSFLHAGLFFLHCDTCHENTHSNIYDYHNIEHVWCDVIVKLKKQNMYTCNDTGTRIWEEHCIPVRHEKHDHCTRIRDEHCIPMRQEKHEHCTRIWRNIAFLNDKKTRALHSNLGGTLESIHKKL